MSPTTPGSRQTPVPSTQGIPSISLSNEKPDRYGYCLTSLGVAVSLATLYLILAFTFIDEMPVKGLFFMRNLDGVLLYGNMIGAIAAPSVSPASSIRRRRSAILLLVYLSAKMQFYVARSNSPPDQRPIDRDDDQPRKHHALDVPIRRPGRSARPDPQLDQFRSNSINPDQPAQTPPAC
jgi:hypothetical protein